jgi:hypothetical protein
MRAYVDGMSIKASWAPGQQARGNTRHLYASRSTQSSDVRLSGFMHTVVGREKARQQHSNRPQLLPRGEGASFKRPLSPNL